MISQPFTALQLFTATKYTALGSTCSSLMEGRTIHRINATPHFPQMWWSAFFFLRVFPNSRSCPKFIQAREISPFTLSEIQFLIPALMRGSCKRPCVSERIRCVMLWIVLHNKFFCFKICSFLLQHSSSKKIKHAETPWSRAKAKALYMWISHWDCSLNATKGMIFSHYLLLLYTTDIKTILQSQIGENTHRKGFPQLSESQLLLVIAGNIHLH